MHGKGVKLFHKLVWLSATNKHLSRNLCWLQTIRAQILKIFLSWLFRASFRLLGLKLKLFCSQELQTDMKRHGVKLVMALYKDLCKCRSPLTQFSVLCDITNNRLFIPQKARILIGRFPFHLLIIQSVDSFEKSYIILILSCYTYNTISKLIQF